MNSKTVFAAALSAYIYARDTLNDQPLSNSVEQDDMYSEAYHGALDRLLKTRAADVSDLRAKMEALWEDPQTLPRADQMLAIMQDLLALTDLEPSRTFNAESWLYDFERFGGGWIERNGELLLMVPQGSTAGRTQDAVADLMFTLEACHGRSAVINAIRAKTTLLAA